MVHLNIFLAIIKSTIFFNTLRVPYLKKGLPKYAFKKINIFRKQWKFETVTMIVIEFSKDFFIYVTKKQLMSLLFSSWRYNSYLTLCNIFYSYCEEFMSLGLNGRFKRLHCSITYFSNVEPALKLHNVNNFYSSELLYITHL